MSRPETYRVLAALISEETGTAPVELTPETVLADLRGWDSVAIAGVLLAIESRFGIEVDRDCVENLTTAKDLADLVELNALRR
jgi:acyl carrier protein